MDPPGTVTIDQLGGGKRYAAARNRTKWAILVRHAALIGYGPASVVDTSYSTDDCPTPAPSCYFVALGGVRGSYVFVNAFLGFVIVNVPSEYAATLSQ